MVIDSITVKWLYQIMMVSSTIVSYDTYFSVIYDNIMFSDNVDTGPTLYDLL